MGGGASKDTDLAVFTELEKEFEAVADEDEETQFNHMRKKFKERKIVWSNGNIYRFMFPNSYILRCKSRIYRLSVCSLILLSTLDPVSKSPLPTIPVPSLDARCSCIDAAIALELKFHDFKPPNRVPG